MILQILRDGFKRPSRNMDLPEGSQHPVDWYPWGEEARRCARRDGLPREGAGGPAGDRPTGLGTYENGVRLTRRKT